MGAPLEPIAPLARVEEQPYSDEPAPPALEALLDDLENEIEARVAPPPEAALSRLLRDVPRWR